ncbi:hypothetical protein [Actinomyces israelii]|jgi:hypothetical protein
MKMLHAGDKLEEPSVVVESELCARHMIVSGKLIEQGGQGAKHQGISLSFQNQL